MGKALDLKGQKFNQLLVVEKTKERKHGCIVWKCLCDCGKYCTATSHDLRSNNKKSCGCLNTQKRKERIIKYNNSNAKFKAGMKINELTLLKSTPYHSGTNIIWQCQCSCGKICYISSNNLNAQQSCGHIERKSLKDITGQKFGKLTALELTPQRKNGCVVWKCRCDCGNICFKRSSDLIRGQVQSCGCLKSKGEEKIIQLLQENGFLFEAQKSFKSCLYNDNLLFFDFYVNNKYLIEYDGIQHFQQTGWEDLSLIQTRDDVKNQWCQQHGIPLIRIPYTKLDTLKMEDLCLETTKFLVSF